MKVLIIATIAAILSAGCASVEVSTPDGMKVKTTTLWKDIESASAQTDGMVLELGSSTANQDAKALLLACVLYPELPGCKQ